MWITGANPRVYKSKPLDFFDFGALVDLNHFCFSTTGHIARSLTPEVIDISMDNNPNADLYATPELQIRREQAK